MPFEIHNIVGSGGVAIVLVAYLLLQIGRLDPTTLIYPSVNALGSVMILYSLFFEWNFPAASIEVAWIAISLVGLGRNVVLRRRRLAAETDG